MKVSIITSCFNRVKTIGDAIESVMMQDYPDIEYIIVDGASKDGSVEVLKEYVAKINSEEFKAAHPRFSFRFISEPDRGMYEGINKGIRMATGDVIGLCHSDDFIFAKDTISHVVKKIEESNCDFLYADGLFVNPVNIYKVVRRWTGGKYTHWKVRHGWLPLHPTCYMKRNLTNKYGLYDEQYKIAADTDLLVRYLLKDDIKVTYLHEFVTRMRMGGMSTDSAKRKKMWDEDIRVYRGHGFRYPTLTKVEKMMWKIPQFITALYK